jgi:hypothetical protein
MADYSKMPPQILKNHIRQIEQEQREAEQLRNAKLAKKYPKDSKKEIEIKKEPEVKAVLLEVPLSPIILPVETLEPVLEVTESPKESLPEVSLEPVEESIFLEVEQIRTKKKGKIKTADAVGPTKRVEKLDD